MCHSCCVALTRWPCPVSPAQLLLQLCLLQAVGHVAHRTIILIPTNTSSTSSADGSGITVSVLRSRTITVLAVIV
jgi:hypothetical protein